MAGLIKDQMAASANDEANEQEPMEGQGPDGSAMHEGAEGEAPEPNEKAESDPKFLAALKFAMQALYDKDGAEGVAESLRSAKDPVEGLSNVSYEIMSVIEERTQGAVPDEYFGLLAVRVLQEVADIAEAAQVPMQPADVAQALKQMILRYLGEQGYNTSQLQQEMDKVNPEMFNQVAQEGAMQ